MTTIHDDRTPKNMTGLCPPWTADDLPDGLAVSMAADRTPPAPPAPDPRSAWPLQDIPAADPAALWLALVRSLERPDIRETPERVTAGPRDRRPHRGRTRPYPAVPDSVARLLLTIATACSGRDDDRAQTLALRALGRCHRWAILAHDRAGRYVRRVITPEGMTGIRPMTTGERERLEDTIFRRLAWRGIQRDRIRRDEMREGRITSDQIHRDRRIRERSDDIEDRKDRALEISLESRQRSAALKRRY
jgi:hypothetical protein